MVRAAEPNGAVRWQSMERVDGGNVVAWLREKREGAGRDRRLLRAGGTPSNALLFRVASDGFDSTAEPERSIFDGPSVVAEVTRSIRESGLEPIAYCHQFVATSGMSAKSSLAMELLYLVTTVYYMCCRDHLDLRNSVAAEHTCRRIVQIQKAVAANPKSPCWEGLGPFMRHCQDSTGVVRAPTFERFVAESNKAEGTYLKQQRLAREEQEAEGKRRGKNGKKGEEENK